MYTGEYLHGEEGQLVFDSVREAINYLAARNFTLQEICNLNFNTEEVN